jgi:hypothetical protein
MKGQEKSLDIADLAEQQRIEKATKELEETSNEILEIFKKKDFTIAKAMSVIGYTTETLKHKTLEIKV